MLNVLYLDLKLKNYFVSSILAVFDITIRGTLLYFLLTVSISSSKELTTLSFFEYEHDLLS